MNTAGGTVNGNSSPNANFTKAQLKAFVSESMENFLSFAIVRNPSAMYAYIKHNYGTAYPNLNKGLETTNPNMNSMSDFLLRQTERMNEAQQKHFIATVFDSLPAEAQFANWTTPIDA